MVSPEPFMINLDFEPLLVTLHLLQAPGRGPMDRESADQARQPSCLVNSKGKRTVAGRARRSSCFSSPISLPFTQHTSLPLTSLATHLDVQRRLPHYRTCLSHPPLRARRLRTCLSDPDRPLLLSPSLFPRRVPTDLTESVSPQPNTSLTTPPPLTSSLLLATPPPPSTSSSSPSPAEEGLSSSRWMSPTSGLSR